MKLKVILASLLLSFGSLAIADATSDAIDTATKAKKAAAAVGFEWNSMGKDIKKAQEAAKAGDDKKAIKIANVVIAHGKAALKQAEIAKKAGPRF